MILQIATGQSADSKVWKNTKISWSDFVTKLSETTYTRETLKELLSYSKEDQSKIKDVGGYVGGYLKNGRRNIDAVVFRQVLTLDIDFATIDFWDDFTLFYNCAAVIHGTHRHCEENPRLRLIIPLSREVTRDEYEAIGRKLAGDLDIDLFDSTTFQPNRLMFWPSTPKDQEYYFESQEGEPLDADQVLNSYADWKDRSLWSVSSKEGEILKSTAEKQEDPTEKKGLIGLFCRTYTVEDAIATFLNDVYVPTDNGRYTYAKGSTSGGVIVYESKYAYSHHGTDPISGKLCNAFDLIRLHKFGNSQESDKKTLEFISQDPEVKKNLAIEKMARASYDFAEFEDSQHEENEEPDLEWMKDLEVDGKGKYLSSALNINLILKHDQQIAAKFKHNDFDQKRYLFKSVPWRYIKNPEPVKNLDYSGVRNYIETIYGITGNLKIDDSLAVEIEKHRYHPVKEYLSGLQWDGVERIKTLLPEYFGVNDNLYTREAMRVTLVGAVSRIFRPGCKFDLVLVLVGEKEGTGKSTFVKKLGGEWFSDTFLTVHGKEGLEQLHGAWIIEMAELAGLRKAEVEAIKHFITKQDDTYRPAYGRVSETYKRQCIFIGTTNNAHFLKEQVGNRRFMPVEVREALAKKDPLSEDLDNERDQIWAEAVALYKSGAKSYLSEEANRIANETRRQHVEIDERAGLISQYLDRLLPVNWEEMGAFDRELFLNSGDKGTEQRQFVCVAEIWTECLDKKRSEMDRYRTREINEIMRGLPNWEAVNSTKNFTLFGKQKYYKRILE